MPLQLDSIAHSPITSLHNPRTHCRVSERRSTILYKTSPKIRRWQNTKTSIHLVRTVWCVQGACLCVSMSKHKRAAASPVWSGSPRGGLPVPMLVVSFYLCHCSLLCFFGFLSYIKCYLSKTKKRNKKIYNNFVVSLHYGLCQSFIEGKMFCVFSHFVT